ncbi:hypothetical protein ADL26_15390, partial [Thermoactinomyces vulgaris]
AAETYAELAVAIARNGDIARAWDALEEGISRAEADRDPRIEAYVWWSRVQVLVCEGRHDEALEALTPAELALRGTVLEDRMRVLAATFRDLIALLQGERPPRAIAGLALQILEHAAETYAELAVAI